MAGAAGIIGAAGTAAVELFKLIFPGTKRAERLAKEQALAQARAQISDLPGAEVQTLPVATIGIILLVVILIAGLIFRKR